MNVNQPKSNSIRLYPIHSRPRIRKITFFLGLLGTAGVAFDKYYWNSAVTLRRSLEFLYIFFFSSPPFYHESPRIRRWRWRTSSIRNNNTGDVQVRCNLARAGRIISRAARPSDNLLDRNRGNLLDWSGGSRREKKEDSKRDRADRFFAKRWVFKDAPPFFFSF